MTNTMHKQAGAPASNQYGKFTVRYATLGQQKYIARLLEERNHELGELDPATVSLKEASAVISKLLQSPVKVDRTKLCSDKQASYISSLAKQKDRGAQHLELALLENRAKSVAELPAQVASLLINRLQLLPDGKPRVVSVEVGAYKYDGVVYSVRKSRESGKLHAYNWSTESNSWVYSGNVKYDLRPEHRLSFDEASEFGALTGTCVHCGRTLTDAKSVKWGIGSTCRRKYA